MLVAALSITTLAWTLDAIFHTFGSVESPPPLIHDTEFTVVINTYKRPQMLTRAVQHYAERCGRRSGVKQVFVVWAESDNPPPTDPMSFFFDNSNSQRLKGSSKTEENEDYRSSVQINQVPNSLNSRFLPIPQMTTTALFMVDDDVQVDCASLFQAFQAWKSHPDSMVGFYPRLASPPRGGSAETHGYIEHCWPIVFLRQQVNFVLTKASFLHRRYLDLYSSSNDDHLQAIRDYVDAQMNCEDFAMSLLVANVTKREHSDHDNNNLPAMPIYVEGSITDRGLFGGISTKSGFVGRRAKCLTDLSRVYEQAWGATPLEQTFPLRQVSWTRHFPGFWWQHRPSNPFEWGALLDFFQ